jgi:heparin binding hemagglutinin HbhA
MAITDDLRKTLSDPTPLYFAAGTADLALQQAKKVPALVEQLRAEAPARFEAVRNTDPKSVQKSVQEKAAARAKEAGARVKETQSTIQAKVGEFFGSLDSDLKKFGSSLDADLKKLGETAQDLALRGVGVAAEYAVKARETYEKVAEHGEQAVKTWRGEAADEIEELAVAVEGKPEPVEVKAEPKPAEARTEPAPAKKQVAKKTAPAARKPAAKKTTPPAK